MHHLRSGVGPNTRSGFADRFRRHRHSDSSFPRNFIQAFDTSTAMGKCFLDMLGVFAEFETNLRKERQLEGIAKAKAAGKYTGRKPSIDAGAVRALKADGVGPSEIVKRLKIARASVYRVLGSGPTAGALVLAVQPVSNGRA